MGVSGVGCSEDKGHCHPRCIAKAGDGRSSRKLQGASDTCALTVIRILLQLSFDLSADRSDGAAETFAASVKIRQSLNALDFATALT